MSSTLSTFPSGKLASLWWNSLPERAWRLRSMIMEPRPHCCAPLTGYSTKVRRLVWTESVRLSRRIYFEHAPKTRAPSWIGETEKAWDDYNRANQGVGLRRIGESEEGGGGVLILPAPAPAPALFSLLHVTRPNPLSSHEPKWRLRQRNGWI